jgi:hypothetical protein|tara:strand:+ start:1634 stop:1798 length:165 start_codon:yes stop_codon:yes gene_type:complete
MDNSSKETRYEMYGEGFSKIPSREVEKIFNTIIVPINEKDSKDYIPINKLGEEK